MPIVDFLLRQPFTVEIIAHKFNSCSRDCFIFSMIKYGILFEQDYYHNEYSNNTHEK